jgi:D-amino-acid dehydrogenase
VSKHVAVVGAGVIGLCTALYCLERGWRVSVVERNGETRSGCSFGNAGMVVPSHIVPLAAPGAVAQALKWMLQPNAPFHIAPRASWQLIDWGLKFWRSANAAHVRRAAPVLRDLHLASRTCYEELTRAYPEISFERTGTLMLCKTEHALDEEARAAALSRELGIEAQVLDARQVEALEPGMRTNVIGAVHFPLDANVIPERLVYALQRHALAGGAQFHWHAPATGFTVENGTLRALRTARGVEIEADEFVLATGAWSQQLGRQLQLRLPVQAGKGYSVTMPRPRVQPHHCAILVEARVFVSPMGPTLRIGGTMEMVGLDETINAGRVTAITDAMSQYYPDFQADDFTNLEPWCGLRPCSPDGLPYIGRTRRLSNVVIAAGHAMMGVSLAPITGKLVMQTLAGERPGVDLSLLSPDRYH